MKHFITVLFVLMSATAFSQITVRYIGAKRTFYNRGDTIRLVVMMRLSPQSCLDGMKKTYIYFSNCENLSNKPRYQSRDKVFCKEMYVRLIGIAGKKAKVTITRDTDKDSFFRQESFNIKK